MSLNRLRSCPLLCFLYLNHTYDLCLYLINYVLKVYYSLYVNRFFCELYFLWPQLMIYIVDHQPYKYFIFFFTWKLNVFLYYLINYFKFFDTNIYYSLYLYL